MNVQVIIPIYHPDDKIYALIESLKKQTIKGLPVMIIDSGSDGAYREMLHGLQADVRKINSREFNHGGTRQKAMDSCKADICVYLTQDAILADEHAIEILLQAFDDSKVGCVYGRQLSHKNASPFARFAREFNYGSKSYVRSFSDRTKFGVKTAFISNSFAAYRRQAMQEIGGFATELILSEDMYAAAKMLLTGWKIAYKADAKAYHSHNYTIMQEFSRYFDIGVFQGREEWIGNTFGKAEGAGFKFLKEEIAFLIKENGLLLFEMLLRDGMKFVGYELGKKEQLFPNKFKRVLSMNKGYWIVNKS